MNEYQFYILCRLIGLLIEAAANDPGGRSRYEIKKDAEIIVDVLKEGLDNE